MNVWITQKDDEVCRNCKHFLQHYVYVGRNSIYTNVDHGYKETFAGHCTKPRVKDREPYDTCKYFERKEEMTPKFLNTYLEICKDANRTPSAEEAKRYYEWQKKYFEKENIA